MGIGEKKAYGICIVFICLHHLMIGVPNFDTHVICPEPPVFHVLQGSIVMGWSIQHPLRVMPRNGSSWISWLRWRDSERSTGIECVKPWLPYQTWGWLESHPKKDGDDLGMVFSSGFPHYSLWIGRPVGSTNWVSESQPHDSKSLKDSGKDGN